MYNYLFIGGRLNNTVKNRIILNMWVHDEDNDE